jgi:formylglycine-generating enzyme required for sulfatase activity
MNSKRLTLATIWPGLLLALACQPLSEQCLFGAEGKRAPQKWALLVGIDEYTHLPALTFAGADQRDLAAQLIKVGFPADQVIVMHDQIGKKGLLPFKGNIERQLELFLDPAQGLVEKGDMVILSFSGHGLALKGKSYLCPTEAKEDDPAATMIPLDNIYQQLDRSRAALKLVLVDACRSDPTRAAGGKTMTRGFATSLRQLPRGLLLLTSCGEGQVAFEEPQFGHGVFMHFVLDGLAGKAADEDGDVTLTGLYTYASSHTKKYVAQKFSGFQTPALEGKIDANFELCRVDVRPTIPLPTAPPPTKPVPVPPGEEPPVVEVKPGKVITNSIGMKLVGIPAGEFMMGSPEAEKGRNKDEQQHRVRITAPFYFGVYEVTLDEFLKFYEAANYKSRWNAQGGEVGVGLKPKNGKYERDTGAQYVPRSWGHPDQTLLHPVVNVSWNDAVAFCEWLSQKEGKHYRLPTEAQWEYACRGGTRTRFATGDDEEGLLALGNVADAAFREAYDGASWGAKGRDGFPFTTPVGHFKPNAFGLYDMHGNAWEWCSDWYDEAYYAASPQDDPQGPATGTVRVNRGGGWNDQPARCRSAHRRWNDASNRGSGLGFRVCLEPLR